MDQEIGARLRKIRLGMGLSQRRLAKLSGVSNATISQIESGAVNPTVGMLKKVLDGVPISLSDFFVDEFEFSEKIFYAAEDLVEIGEGGVSYRQVAAELRDKSIQLLHEHYLPGAGTGRHALTHEGEECGIVLKGRLRVTVGDSSRVLGPGEAYYFSSHQPHSFENAGREVCELISASTPPTF